jgi:hypothetical protein
MNATCLYVMDDSDQVTPFWSKFLDIMDEQFVQLHGVMPHNSTRAELFTQHMTQVLMTYGATTNWVNEHDPIWFPDPEQLTSFVLTYS